MNAPHNDGNAAPLLVFVCTGNICRSPMAEAIARAAARDAGVRIRVASSGTMGIVGAPAEEHAQEVLAEIGLSLRDHQAQQTKAADVREATLVVALTRSHRYWLLVHEPEAQHIVTFDELTGLGDVPDPYGASPDEYRAIRDMLVAGMPYVLAELKARHAASTKGA